MWFSNAHILCFFPRNLEKRSCALKGQTGVSCVKNYVSKRGYKFWGLVRFGGKLHHEKSCKRTNPPKHTQVSYVLKRNFLHNTPRFTPHIKWSVLYLHHRSWRLLRCFDKKFSTTKAWQPMDRRRHRSASFQTVEPPTTSAILDRVPWTYTSVYNINITTWNTCSIIPFRPMSFSCDDSLHI